MPDISIGIDYSRIDWKVCLIEDGQTMDYLTFPDQESVVRWLAHTCALYPEPAIGFSSRLACRFGPASARLYAPDTFQDPDTHVQLDFLDALATFSQQSYCLPSISHLPSIPAHRLVLHPAMGAPNVLCSIATLLHRMRQSEATWEEMRFLCLEIGPWSSTISVVQDGLIIDALETSPILQKLSTSDIRTEAFWEELTQNLAGLMAVHHFADIVISQQADSADAAACKEEVIQRLGDLYQFYLYPQSETKFAGFESAFGAALLVAGFSQSGPMAELAARLLAVVP
ncbi:MAG TPA: DUF1464 family protein [Ktedonobacteraceae bacterium]|jgi:hypothetical protein